jgi:hypothetical protein
MREEETDTLSDSLNRCFFDFEENSSRVVELERKKIQANLFHGDAAPHAGSHQTKKRLESSMKGCD